MDNVTKIESKSVDLMRANLLITEAVRRHQFAESSRTNAPGQIRPPRCGNSTSFSLSNSTVQRI